MATALEILTTIYELLKITVIDLLLIGAVFILISIVFIVITIAIDGFHEGFRDGIRKGESIRHEERTKQECAQTNEQIKRG